MSRPIAIAFRPLALALLLLAAGCSSADSKTSARAQPAKTAPADDASPAKPLPSGTASAVFAGGCFWCLETAYEGKPGVIAVVSGFAGGKQANPTYDEVSAGRTGHAEVVEVAYDPKVISYAQLLDIFWHNIDPTQANGQFCDRGSQYRSAIFYGSPEEKQLAEASKADAGNTLQKAIVTEIVPASPFYPAEDYHQDFWKKDPDRYFSYREGCGRDARLKQLWGRAPDVAH
jgi:peptide-methionine (S)-S-oxide reductase